MKTALLALLAAFFALPAAAQQVNRASRPPGGSLYSVQYQTNGLLFGGVTLGGNQILVGQASGPPLASTVSAAIDAAIGSTRGALLERGASGWTLLPPGTSGFCLTSTGSGSDPIYQACTGGGGTLTIVALSMPGIFSVAGSPVTGGGGTMTVTLGTESANQVWAGPASGSAAAPAFRALVGADLPASGVTAGTYGNASHAAEVTINAAGVVTGASSIAITGVDAATINGATPAPSAVLDATNLNNDSTGVLYGLAALPAIGANTALMNATGLGAASPTAVPLPTCPVLSYTGGTGYSCATLTGTGSIVLSNSPALVTPNLGTPSAINLTHATSLPATALPSSGVTAGSYTGANITVDATGRLTAAANGSGGGTVTSVGLSMPGIFNVGGTPVTTSGSLAVTLATQSANTIWAGPTSGSAAAPGFRALVAADLPSGVAQLGTPNTFTATQTFGTIGGYVANNQSRSTSCTLGTTSGGCSGQSTGDCGTQVVFTAAATVTVPATLPVGCEVALVQDGSSAVVTVNPGSATQKPFPAFTHTAGDGAVIGIDVLTNAGGSSAVYSFTGGGA